MEIQSLPRKIHLAGIALLAITILFAFKNNPRTREDSTARFHDTIPPQNRAGDSGKSVARDFDHELAQLEDARKQLRKMENIDLEAVQLELARALEEIDSKKIQEQVEKAIASVNPEKIQAELNAALAGIEAVKMESSLESSLDKLSEAERTELKRELEKARTEIKKQLENTELQQSIQKAQAEELKNVQVEMEKAKAEIRKAVENLRRDKINLADEKIRAEKEIDKAKAEISGFQKMVYDLESAGLLDTKTDYRIELKNKQLFINQKLQPESVYQRYHSYFKSGNGYIEKKEGKLNLNQNNPENEE